MTTAAQGPSSVLSAGELAELVAEFTGAAERLQGTHEALRGEAERLRGELASTKAELRRARQLAQLGEVAAGIAHEVRNPLGSMKLYIGALISDLEAMPAQRDVATRIDRAIDTVDAIVRDVLTLARDRRARAVPVTVGELVSASWRACADPVARAGAALRWADPAPAGVVLRCDPPMVEQALTNILRNACESMAEAGAACVEREVRIAVASRVVRAASGEAMPVRVLRISDTGPGISAEAVERAFNPFYTTRDAGTGLGLAIVHRIVDAHGGRVTIYANRDRDQGAVGTSVEVALPERAGDGAAATTTMEEQAA